MPTSDPTLALLMIVTLDPVPIELPDAATIQMLFDRPRIAYCDELVCSHHRPVSYRVRNLSCAPGSGVGSAICTYDRTEWSIFDVEVVPLGADGGRRQTEPPRAAAEPVWTTARTRFRRFNGRWVVETDEEVARRE